MKIDQQNGAEPDARLTKQARQRTGAGAIIAIIILIPVLSVLSYKFVMFYCLLCYNSRASMTVLLLLLSMTPDLRSRSG